MENAYNVERPAPFFVVLVTRYQEIANCQIYRTPEWMLPNQPPSTPDTRLLIIPVSENYFGFKHKGNCIGWVALSTTYSRTCWIKLRHAKGP